MRVRTDSGEIREIREKSQEDLSYLRRAYVGKRVRLYNTGDPYTMLRQGDEGLVTSVDDMGTIHVKWDNGSTLGMILDAGDRIELIQP